MTTAKLRSSAVLFALGLAVAAPAPVSATTTTSVAISMYAFTPAAAGVPLGGIVSWTNHDGVAHTSTSDEGFWSSPAINPGASYSRHFYSAGVFPYHCAFHTEMHGHINVPMHAALVTNGIALRWAWVTGRYDVQMELPGSTTWQWYRASTGTESATLATTRRGTFHFRARTRGASLDSGWSPVAAVTR